LGLSQTQLDLLHRMLSRPEGILLVTGPTGSGKTTTLYSILQYLNAEGVNIMTLEDPVEFPMPYVRQASISDAIKMDFADGIRSMMRQDPDIILVGEVRDHATAEMAFRAAMTGHQVFSTLHSNSALRAIPRLLDLGIAPQVLAGNVIGVVAQRLVRKLCPLCKQPQRPSDEQARCLGLKEGDEVTLYRSVGCSACEFRGFKGRLAIVELLKFDAELDELVTQNAGLKSMAAHVRENGFMTMADDGLRRVRDGDTTLEEVGRVLDLTELIR
jgi:type II secretory ATPase GspE/PulE/Tfp pilus assembly ATPase PilB-like protein